MIEISSMSAGELFTEGDAIYKVLYIDSNNGFAVVNHYSMNHKIYNIELWKQDSVELEYISKLDEDWGIFDDIDIDRLY